MSSILFFLDELYYYDSKTQGYVSKSVAGEFVKSLAKELNLNAGFAFPVDKKNLGSYSSVVINPKEFIVEELPTWDSILSYYKFISKIADYKFLKRKVDDLVDKYDIFWIRLPSPFGLWLGEEAERSGKLVLYHIAGDIRKGYLSKKYKGLTKVLAKYLGLYLHNKSLKLGSNGYFLCTGRVLYNEYKKKNKKAFPFIDSLVKEEDLKPPKSELILPVKFLYVGRLIEEKGIFFLIEALKEIKKTIPLELHIVGFGKEEEIVKNISQNEDFIKFYGFVPFGERLFEIYETCNVFVLPTVSYPEGFPRVILEAWSQGLFVISSDVGGITGIGIDRENILLFRPGDKEDFMEKVVSLINDKLLQKRLSKGIEEVQKIITFESNLRLIKDLIGEVK